MKVITGVAFFFASIIASCSACAQVQDSQGEMRLRSPLSSLPYQLAIGPEGSFAAVSGRDGVVTQFDLEIKERTDLYFSPIRSEEPERQRPVAISPGGDLIAVGAPFELGVPNTARIYFFAQSNPRRTLFTIDGLPERPTALRFISDRGGVRLRLIVGFAKGRPPAVWDVTSVAQAAADPDRKIRVGGETPLPEPYQGFFLGCGRDECSVWVIAVPPRPLSSVALLIGGDSGLVLYDEDFDVVAYGAPSNNRSDLRRIGSISFSKDGTQFALGKLELLNDEKPPNHSCQVDVYDLRNFRPPDGADKRFALSPKVLEPPPRAGEKETEGCNFAQVAWSGDSIFAGGVYWRSFAQVAGCKTNKDLNERFDPEAMTMLRFALGTEPKIDLICVGTNRIVDLQPVPDGGVALVAQDPLFAVYDADGKQAYFPGHTQALRNDGTMLDLRGAADGDELLGDVSVDDEGSIVLLRPFLPSKTYIALDLRPSGLREPLIVSTRRDAIVAKTELVESLGRRRGVEKINFVPRSRFPQQCLGWDLPVNETMEKLIIDLDGAQREQLSLRPQEHVRDIEFLPPSGQGGNLEWRAVIGTSHRILYTDCAGHDLWHGGRLITQAQSAGIPIRDDAYQVRVSGNRRFLIAAHGDGVLRWYELTSGRLAWSVFVDRDLRSWIAWTPDGHFDSSQDLASWSVGWLQSIARDGGVWSITMEPLAKYDQWREPNLLRNRISATVINTAVARAAPDQGDPTVKIESVTFSQGDQATATVSLRVENFFDPLDQLESNIELKAERAGVVTPTRFVTASKERSALVHADFRLNECLQQDGQTFRISARIKGRNSQDKADVKYLGPTSATPCNLPRVFGIFIGIDKYDKLPALQYADQDAKKFYDFWSKGSQEGSQTFYEVGQLLLITVAADGIARKVTKVANGSETNQPIGSDRDAIRSAMDQQLTAIQNSKPGRGDVVVIYLSGHGVAQQVGPSESWFFMAPNGDRDHPEDTAFSAKDLRNKLTAFVRPEKGTKVLVFVDACRNIDITYGPNPQRALTSDLMEFARDNELMGTVFVATLPDSSSYEFPQSDFRQPKHIDTCEPSANEPRGAGAFTQVLLNLFENAVGNEKKIDTSMIMYPLRAGVSKICAKQQPLVKNNPNDYLTDLVLGR